MLETFAGNKFEYTKLSPDEQKERGILGTLYGPIADTKQPTRNGRLYPREAWEKAINDPIFQEQLQSKAVLGELEHPTDREEIKPQEACMCLASTPKIGDDGMLYGEFHILDLPNGRILKTLCDYGTVIGVSSRGNGDVTEDYDGNSSVEPDTFDLTCWDAVILPAVKKARMNYVKESLNGKSLRESLNKLVDDADSSVKESMKNTIKAVEKKLNEDINTQKSDNINKKVEDTKETVNQDKEVNDVDSKSLVKSLTESLRSRVALEKQVQELQEQLAVSNTKVSSLEEEVDRYKKTSVRLSAKLSESKDLKQENQSLKEQLKQKDVELIGKNSNISILRKKLNESVKSNKTLTESTNSRDSKINTLNESLKNAQNEIKSLKEQLEQSKINNKKYAELESSLNKSKKLVEKYKNDTKAVVNKYINSKATMLGISPSEIRNRLDDDFTLEDIDKICESLQQYNLRIGKLPFNVGKKPRVRITESRESQYEEPSLADDVSGLEELKNLL